ncbi:MAG TPA: HNH endonuclease [Trichocoleus sp.]
MNTLICVYCGTPTDGTESAEHIVPESLGGEDTLYLGAVCTKCNTDLGKSVDSKLFEEALMAAGMVALGVKGKKGPRKEIRSKKVLPGEQTKVLKLSTVHLASQMSIGSLALLRRLR